MIDLSKLEENIKIENHKTYWADWYEKEKSLLEKVFQENLVEIEHIGSSSVEGLVSKPIVDIVIGLKDFEINKHQIENMRNDGYEYFGQLHEKQKRFFARKRGNENFNLQIVPYKGVEWIQYLAFRDYLRNHQDAVNEYSNTKIEAAKLGKEKLLEYHSYKVKVVDEILKKALEYHKFKENIQKVFNKSDLGILINAPKKVSGGLLHKMYKIETDRGIYAVKVLNPLVMKRGEAVMKNYIFSEKITHTAKENGIPAIPAIGDKEFIHPIGDEHYMVFKWVDAKSISPSEVSKEHCTKIGEILAKLHSIDFTSLYEKVDTPEVITTEWNKYVQVESEILNTLEKVVDKIYEWNRVANSSVEIVHKNQIISHRDMDCKNVLWDEKQNPIIIDWEAAGYVNPLQELIDLAFNWGGIETDSFKLENFKNLVESYIKCGGKIQEDIKAVLNFGYKGKLEWLEYNIKRSLGIECSSEEEKQIGIVEVKKTIAALRRYEELLPICEEILREHAN